MKKANIKAIIWDMGGVILRTDDFSSRDLLAKKLGSTRKDLEKEVFYSASAIQATLGTITSKDHWQNIANHFHLDAQGLEDFIKGFWEGDRMDIELVDYIRKLKNSFRTGLLSNAWSDTRNMLINRHPCLDAFHEAIFSAEVHLMKPDPKIFHLILDKLRVLPGESIFVDDFPENITGAQEVGIHGILFQTREQAITEIDQLIS